MRIMNGVIGLADNTIDLVRKAEADAENTARDASIQAGRIVDEANTEAVKLANSAEDAARDKAAADVAAAHQAGASALEAAMASLDGDMKALAEKARAKQPEAIKQILDALV